MSNRGGNVYNNFSSTLGGIPFCLVLQTGCCCLLLAAAVIDFAPVVRRRLSPASWWHDERLLFTPRGGDLRQKYGAWAFLLGVMVYEFLVVFNNSMARENWPWLQTQGLPGAGHGSSTLLLWGKNFAGYKVQLAASILCAGMLYFVARWVYFNGQNIWWLGLCDGAAGRQGCAAAP